MGDIDKKKGVDFTQEELAILDRKFGGKDPSKIPNPDPNFAYRWVRTDYPNDANIARQRGEGWEVVNSKAEIEKMGFKQGEDGSVKIPPDLVLAKMPKHLSDEIDRRTAEINKQRRAMAKNRTKGFAERMSEQLGVNIPVIEGDTPLGREGGK